MAARAERHLSCAGANKLARRGERCAVAQNGVKRQAASVKERQVGGGTARVFLSQAHIRAVSRISARTRRHREMTTARIAAAHVGHRLCAALRLRGLSTALHCTRGYLALAIIACWIITHASSRCARAGASQRHGRGFSARTAYACALSLPAPLLAQHIA